MLHLSSVGGQARDQEDLESKVREGGEGGDGPAGEGGRNRAGVNEGGRGGGVCAHLLCVSCRSAGAEADLFPQ